MKKLASHHFKQQAEVYSRQSTKKDVTVAGERALVCLYGGHPDENLDDLDTNGSRRRLVVGHQQFRLIRFHQPPQLLAITVLASICKYSSGSTHLLC